MPEITYNDLDGTSPVITVHGHKLKSGESFKTDNDDIVGKLSGNPWFSVSGKKAGAETEAQKKGIEANGPTDVELADVRAKGAAAFSSGKKASDVPPAYRGEKNWRAQAWKEGYEAQKAKADEQNEG